MGKFCDSNFCECVTEIVITKKENVITNFIFYRFEMEKLNVEESLVLRSIHRVKNYVALVKFFIYFFSVLTVALNVTVIFLSYNDVQWGVVLTEGISGVVAATVAVCVKIHQDMLTKLNLKMKVKQHYIKGRRNLLKVKQSGGGEMDVNMAAFNTILAACEEEITTLQTYREDEKDGETAMDNKQETEV